MFPGGGFKIAMFLGVYDTLVKNGQKPDYIISTCGSSIAAGIINKFPNKKERISFLKSKNLFETLKKIQVNKPSYLIFAKVLTKIISNLLWSTPDPSTKTILQIPQKTSIPEFQKPISVKTPKILIIGAKILNSKKDFKLEEVIFTDKETKKELKNISAPLSQKTNRVVPKLRIIANKNLDQAIRSAIADPFYINPAKIDKDYFMGSIIDLYPYEIAKTLGAQIISAESPLLNTLEQAAVKAFLDFDQNERRNEIDAKKDYHKIKLSNAAKDLRKVDFQIKAKLSGIFLQMPKRLDEYQKRTEKIYQYGVEKTLEFLKTFHL